MLTCAGHPRVTRCARSPSPSSTSRVEPNPQKRCTANLAAFDFQAEGCATSMVQFVFAPPHGFEADNVDQMMGPKARHEVPGHFDLHYMSSNMWLGLLFDIGRFRTPSPPQAARPQTKTKKDTATKKEQQLLEKTTQPISKQRPLQTYNMVGRSPFATPQKISPPFGKYRMYAFYLFYIYMFIHF